MECLPVLYIPWFLSPYIPWFRSPSCIPNWITFLKHIFHESHFFDLFNISMRLNKRGILAGGKQCYGSVWWPNPDPGICNAIWETSEILNYEFVKKRRRKNLFASFLLVSAVPLIDNFLNIFHRSGPRPSDPHLNWSVTLLETDKDSWVYCNCYQCP